MATIPTIRLELSRTAFLVYLMLRSCFYFYVASDMACKRFAKNGKYNEW